MPFTARNIAYPDGTSLHPSATWWKTMADSVDVAIGEVVEEANWGEAELAADTDLNTVLDPGYYPVTTTAVAESLVNAPRGASTYPGTLEVMRTPNGILIQRFTEYASALRVWVRSTQSVTNNTMTPWRSLAFADEASGVSSAGHTVRAQSARNRRGGVIGTGGKPVVALRFDHGWGNFGDIVLPLLRQHNLPASICANPRNWHRTENNGLTAADVEPWLVEDGVELWNHGATHNDATGQAAIYDEIVTSLAELRTQFPRVAIDGWMPPGPAAINPEVGVYDGYGNGSTDAQHDTYAGQIILAHHGMATGYRAGNVLPLDGRPTVGARHYTWDSASLANVQSRVNEAIDHRGGVILMLHPSLIGDTGPSAALVADVLGWIAAQRDAGTIEVMTVGGLLHADRDATTTTLTTDTVDVAPARHDLLPALSAPVTLAAAASTTHSATADAWAYALGGVRRIDVELETTAAGSLTVAVEGAGTKTLTIPAAGRHVLSRHVTIPADATRCHVTVTPSVAATVHDVSALAV
jgi:peptidoglycan/xylan/chitin deacetylase (PgdA/CDA1 family)